jgi:hypothetical protein
MLRWYCFIGLRKRKLVGFALFCRHGRRRPDEQQSQFFTLTLMIQLLSEQVARKEPGVRLIILDYTNEDAILYGLL